MLGINVCVCVIHGRLISDHSSSLCIRKLSVVYK